MRFPPCDENDRLWPDGVLPAGFLAKGFLPKGFFPDGFEADLLTQAEVEQGSRNDTIIVAGWDEEDEEEGNKPIP